MCCKACEFGVSHSNHVEGHTMWMGILHHHHLHALSCWATNGCVYHFCQLLVVNLVCIAQDGAFGGQSEVHDRRGVLPDPHGRRTAHLSPENFGDWGHWRHGASLNRCSELLLSLCILNAFNTLRSLNVRPTLPPWGSRLQTKLTQREPYH